MDDWRINFGQNMRHLRQVHGLTQRQMAQIIGVSVTTYGKMEQCDPKVRIHIGKVKRICDHFHIDIEEILYQNWPQILQDKEKTL